MINWLELKNEFVAQFSTEHGKAESESMFRLLRDHFTTQEILNSDDFKERWNEINDRLIEHEPVQYILGYAWFYDLKIRVNKHVLIPRPETEELVHLIIQDTNDKELKIIDIGTGSGCISLAIKSKLSKSNVIGIDVSTGALEVAKNNAKKLKLTIDFKQIDISDHFISNNFSKIDIVVSNPPYIDLFDKNDLATYVTDNEPQIALFTPKYDALYFYRAIISFCKIHLVEMGKLYLELNEFKAKEVLDHCKKSKLFTEIELLTDMQGKQRFLRATKL